MRNTRILKHIFEVTVSNLITIASGIVVGFILPKIISVEGYGYYKTFTLYVTYLGLFSLGMIDGIVLDYGGVDYEKIDKPLFRSYFKWYIVIHLVFASLIIFFSYFIMEYEIRFIVLMLALNLISVNVSGYFQNVSQITQRFKEYSIRKILQSIFNVIVVVLMLLVYRRIGEIEYKIYIISLTVVNASLAAWYIYTYREIVFGKPSKVITIRSDIYHLIRIGFPLLFANLCSTLILTLDRQFVNFLFDTTTYAVYAFAYSMLALVTVATSAIATVLYPALKRTTEETMKQTYSALVTLLMITVFAFEVIYYPLNWFIQWFLPKYKESLMIFRIIFPGLGISSVITVVIHNYYKALGRNLEYFKKSVVVIVFSALANLIAYLLFRTTTSISVASIITMVFWYLYLESLFRRKYNYNWKKNFTYLITMVLCFYIATSFPLDAVGLLFYICIYLFITTSFYRKDVGKIITLLHIK